MEFVLKFVTATLVASLSVLGLACVPMMGDPVYEVTLRNESDRDVIARLNLSGTDVLAPAGRASILASGGPFGRRTIEVMDGTTCQTIAELTAQGEDIAFVLRPDLALEVLAQESDASSGPREIDTCLNRVVAPPTQATTEPPGGTIYFIDGQGSDVWTVNADGSELQRLAELPGRVERADWSATGSGVAFDSVDETTHKVVVSVLDPDTGVSTMIARSASRPMWQPGTHVLGFVGGGAHDPGVPIEAIEPDGSGRRTLVAAGGPFAWSPDGSQLAFTLGGSDGEGPLFISDADGSDLRQVAGDLIAQDPVWSPNGASIAFTSHPPREGTADVYVLEVATGVTHVVYASIPHETAPSWSPDSESLAFMSGGGEVVVADVDGARQVVVRDSQTFESLGYAVWSPDGEWIAFDTGETAFADLHLIRPDGTDGHVLVTGVGFGRAFAWIP